MSKPIILGIIGAGIAYFVNYVYETAPEDDVFVKLTVTVLAGLYAGLLFLIFVLPAISDGIAKLIYSDPGGEPESDDPMHEARALQAQGDYVGALDALRQVVMKEPENRLAWTEMAKLQITNIEDAEGGLATLKEALIKHQWPDDDAAFFMFRLSEVQLEQFENRDEAIRILQDVCTKFPETKHSANATHQLRELEAL